MPSKKPKKRFEDLDPRDYIIVKGARLHNLKHIDVAIPRNELVVVTGVSGSGKSSLVFDTLFAEGQRKYVESLSSYARQFLNRMKKPEVDYIKGLSPAMAIEQKTASRNPRSTVGTSTEIYDYLKLLFARAGHTISPVSGERVQKDSVTDVCAYINTLPKGTKVFILAHVHKPEGRSSEKELDLLLQKGFTRLWKDGKTLKIQDLLDSAEEMQKLEEGIVHILVDRIVLEDENDEQSARMADSVQTAFYEGLGDCNLLVDGELRHFSDRFELDDMRFEEPSVDFFSFSNPYGACKRCEGFGSILGIDEDLVIPDKSLSVFEGAIACWRSEKMGLWKDALVNNAHKFDFPVHRAYHDLDEDERDLLWRGNNFFEGLSDFFAYIESKKHKIQYRVMLSRFRGRTVCPDCKGTRLRKDADYVKLQDVRTGESLSIIESVLLSIDALHDKLSKFSLSQTDQNISKRLFREILNRLSFLQNVGLGYLNLNRRSNTLSGGEAQRIKLATSLGSSLVGSLYILDEPSIGLHPRDSERLVKVLINLRDQGNTVIVVEHEEEVIKAADTILDIGPFAGSNGGALVFQGRMKELLKDKQSLTGAYLSGAESIPIPELRRPWHHSIKLVGASEHNLKNLDVEFPLNILCCVTGVSGSGKTTLVKEILYNSLKKILAGVGDRSGSYRKLEGDYSLLEDVEMIDQNPIGRSSRSNPATYTKAYDQIRNLMAAQPLAKLRAYKPGFFSFNTKGGRCDVCEGEGTVSIDMQFLADITLECESCRGHRFKEEVLEITYLDKNIYQILEMTVDEAMEFFVKEKAIINKIKPLQDVGLGYVQLGQAASTLSGGEAQRIKLASFLGRGTDGKNKLFIFDEPTTGLHFNDIKKLLKAFSALIDQGNTIISIEHNTEIIKSADWVIDLGPEGGDKGGELVFAGTPEDLVKAKRSFTGPYLREKV